MLLVAVELCALAPPVPKIRPQALSQLVLPERVRFIAGSTPLVSNAVLPLPSLNSQRAMMSASKRLLPEATVPA